MLAGEVVFGPKEPRIDAARVVREILRDARELRTRMLRCKFKVSQIIREGQGRTLKLAASNSVEGDNKDWSQWTPSGEFQIYVTNPAAFERIDAMKPGDLFWIDLKKVEPAGE